MYRRLEEKHRMARMQEQMRMQLIYQKYLQQLRANPLANPLNNLDLNQFPMALGNQDFGGFTLPGTSSSTGLPLPSSINQSTPAQAPLPHPTITEIIDLND